MKLGERKANRKTESLNIRLDAETKKVLQVLSEGTEAKTITSVIESFVNAYQSGKISVKDLKFTRAIK